MFRITGKALSCDVRDRQDERRLVVQGELDIVSAPTLAHVLAMLRDGDRRPVRVDLSHVSFCDSTGLEPLLEAMTAERPATQPGPVSVTAASSCVSQLLAILRPSATAVAEAPAAVPRARLPLARSEVRVGGAG